MQVSKFTEVRESTGIKVDADENLFVYTGTGYNRSDWTGLYGVNAGLSPHRKAGNVDGVLPGVVKVTPMKHALGWFSLRSTGKEGNGRTVYVKGDTTIAVLGEPLATVQEFYTKFTQ